MSCSTEQQPRKPPVRKRYDRLGQTPIFNAFALRDIPSARPPCRGSCWTRDPNPRGRRTVVADSAKKHRVVIVGAGFAGFHAARELSRVIGATTEIVVINSTDYFLYLPLMPQVTGGLVEPAHIRASLTRRLRRMRFVLGTVNHVDAKQKVVSWAGQEGSSGQIGYDRLILTAGSVNKLLPIPGLADYAHGFRSIAEAMYLRDHIT